MASPVPKLLLFSHCEKADVRPAPKKGRNRFTECLTEEFHLLCSSVPVGIVGPAAMKLSTTVRYGARAATQLAAAYPDRAVSVREVERRAKHLSEIPGAHSAGPESGWFGSRGSRHEWRLPLSAVAREYHSQRSIRGPRRVSSPVDCVDCPDSCSMHDVCPTRDTWVELKEAIETVLERTTIRDLVERKKRKAISPAPTYQI